MSALLDELRELLPALPDFSLTEAIWIRTVKRMQELEEKTERQDRLLAFQEREIASLKAGSSDAAFKDLQRQLRAKDELIRRIKGGNW